MVREHVWGPIYFTMMESVLSNHNLGIIDAWDEGDISKDSDETDT